MKLTLLTTLVVVACSASLSAQSFNLDFGETTSAPSSSYSAAGLPGFWNALSAQNNDFSFLTDVAGNPTSVLFHQYGATGLVVSSDPIVTGDDALLLRDGIVTHNPSLDSCFYFDGLAPGTYELITYAWRPDDPALLSKSFVDNTPGLEISGGAWSGQHVHGVTFARHTVTVGPSGFMGPHSGLAAGADAFVGAVCNGMQLRKLDLFTPFCFGDGTLPTPCPCAPPNTVPNPSGAAGHGCANSFDANGALLSASGSLAPDGVAFTCVVGPNYGAFGFLVKGSASNATGAALGDGISCVSGALVRFGGHNAGTNGAPLGSWTYPNVVQTIPVTSATAQAPAQQAYYQLYYRNAVANFCSAATANLSNGVAIVWP
ncbi:MAG: hypothetical protein ACKVWV_02535 [Planctomycetota bacterium]